MATECFVKTRKNRCGTFGTLVTKETEPATVADLDREARWFRTVGHLITRVTRVAVSLNSVEFPGYPYTESGFEVEFECGAVGYVPNRPHSELDGLVVNGKGYLHGLAVWRKRGKIVGNPVPWALTKHGPRARLNPDRLPRVCAAELYSRAAGSGDNWGPVYRERVCTDSAAAS